MNILFLTLLDFESLNERNIYTDLLREFQRRGHSIWAISPVERRNGGKTRRIVAQERVEILKLKIGNMQKTNIIEKGISTITIEKTLIRAIKTYYSDICFDMVLYATPPITFQKTVKYVKKRDNATTYLMLKDIFPQNAVDIGMLKKSGISGIVYRYFRNKEKKLYHDSDYVGCMSEANVNYLVRNNPELDKDKVGVCPNGIEPTELLSAEDKQDIRRKYGLPNDRVIYIYGGNLGKPQGIPFMLSAIMQAANDENAFFIIVGSGTEYSYVEKKLAECNKKNILLLSYLPKEEYEKVVKACDVGLIFLDSRFTIPNFPSRLLSYMNAFLPIIAATDKNTDVGKVIEENKFGVWCESKKEDDFVSCVEGMSDATRRREMGERSRKYLEDNYTAFRVCNIICNDVGK